MDKIHMVDLKSQYSTIKDEIDTAIQNVIDTAFFINGPDVKSFTQQLNDYMSAGYTVPCGNGTDALQAALMALDLEKGSEIITTSFTFVATAEVIKLLKLKPVFADIDPLTFNIDPKDIRRKITANTRCILPVHLFGQSADMEDITSIAKEHNLFVIEDNAQAIGSSYLFSNGTTKKTGTIGDIGTTSFFPSKNLGCYGDGGAIFCDDEVLAKRIKAIVNHGSAKKYYYQYVGINSRLDSIQAAVLSVKLKYLDEYGMKRKRAASIYDTLLSGIKEVQIPYRKYDHVFHQYTVRISKNRDMISEYLKEKGIPHGIYYPEGLHLQKPYQEDGKKIELPETDKATQEVLSLPMHTELTFEMQNQITNVLKEAIEKFN